MKKIIFSLIFLLVISINTFASNVEDLDKKALLILETFDGIINLLIGSGTLSSAETLCGLPHFEAGLGSSIGKITYIDPNTSKNISIYAPIPFVQGRIGVFSGISILPTVNILSIDLGGKYGITGSNETEIQSKIFGGEIRIGLLKGILFPAISIVTTYNKLSNMEIGTKKDDVYTNFHFTTTGITFLVSKKILFFTPYVGIGTNKNSTEMNYILLQTISKTKTKESQNLKILVGGKFSLFKFSLFTEYNYIPNMQVFALGAKVNF